MLFDVLAWNAAALVPPKRVSAERKGGPASPKPRSGEGGNSNRLLGIQQHCYTASSPSFTIVSTSSAIPIAMILRASRVRMVVVGLAVGLVLGPLAACRRKEAPAPPVATPSVTLNHDRAPLGSPLDITYKFVVANDARFAEDLRVMAHVVDADGQMMWDDDHNPPVPTTQWKPGQTVEYTRTVFVRVYPYVGEASIQVGLYSVT